MSRIWTYLGAVLCVACSGGDKPPPAAAHSGGAASGTGGTTVGGDSSGHSGGVQSVGGQRATGGTRSIAAGGTTNGGVAGGLGGIAGAAASGGTSGTGGTSGIQSVGGKSATGGTSGTGGTGGIQSVGGKTATGGTGGIQSVGGRTAAGGMGGMVTSTSTGGSVSTGAATSLCSSSATPGSPQPVPGVTVANDAWFSAITPDELTIVWTVARANNSLTVYAADRTSVSTGFSSPQSIGISSIDNLVSISPDGLQIAYVSADGRGIDVLSRTTRLETFQNPTGTWDEFSNFNAAGALATGETYLRPLYGPIPTVLYYGVTSSTGDITWNATYRTSAFDAFPLGLPLSFLSSPSNNFVLSGVSGDNATLLFVNGTESDWLFLNSAGNAYSSLASLGPFGIVQVNQACNRLYYGPSAGSLAVVPLT